MVKWEYLKADLLSTGVEVTVRKAEREALAQYLQNALESEAKTKIRKDGVIEIKDNSGSQLLDTLGDLGWELVGFAWYGGNGGFFKRPREG